MSDLPRLTYRQQLKLLQQQAKTEGQELEAARHVAAPAEAAEERLPRRSRRKSSSKENAVAVEDAAAAAAAAGGGDDTGYANENVEMKEVAMAAATTSGEKSLEHSPNVGTWTEATMPTTANARKRRTIKVKMTVTGKERGVIDDDSEEEKAGDSKPNNSNNSNNDDMKMIGDPDLDDGDDDDEKVREEVKTTTKKSRRLDSSSLDDDDDDDDKNDGSGDPKLDVYKRIRKRQLLNSEKKSIGTKKSDSNKEAARVSPNPNSIPRRKIAETAPTDEAKSADTAPLLTMLMGPSKPASQPQGQLQQQPPGASSNSKGPSNTRGSSGGGGGFKRPPVAPPPRQLQQQQQLLPPTQHQVINIDAFSGSSHNAPLSSHSMPPQYNTGPWILSEQEKHLLESLEHFCTKLSEDPKFQLPPVPPRFGNTNTIDLSGSFVRSNDNENNSKADLDFFDLDESGAILIPKKIPIFPEDFPPGMPEWPLSWWGIVDPALADLEAKPSSDVRSGRRTPPPYSAGPHRQSGNGGQQHHPQHGQGRDAFGGRGGGRGPGGGGHGGGSGWDGGRMDRGGGPPPSQQQQQQQGRPSSGGGRGPPFNWPDGREGGGPPPDDWQGAGYGRNQGPPPPFGQASQQRNRR